MSSQQLVVGDEKKVKILLFTDLKAWQESHQLVKQTYLFLGKLPRDERFGLIDQMRRAAISITSNIAEGFGRQGIKEKIQFYYISLGSLCELQNQILLAKDVYHIKDEDCDNILKQSVVSQKLINGLIRSIKEKIC